MGYCMTCGETYRNSPGFYTCDLCKEREVNRSLFGLPAGDPELLRCIKKDKNLVSEIKMRLTGH